VNAELLKDMARHQAWADGLHWKALRENAALLEDAEIRKRLSHMATAMTLLTLLARGETPDPSAMNKEFEGADELEAAIHRGNAELEAALSSVDLDQMISLPRGPQGPWKAPAGALLLQAITHNQHHRGQNAQRIRALGGAPPMTDYIVWYALGRP